MLEKMKLKKAKSSNQVVSLFCGAGGLSLGFLNAGLKPIISADVDAYACETYKHNINSNCLNLDLSQISPDFFAEILNGTSPFAVIGGPPCQGFSTAGARDKNDPRNQLIFNYLNIVRTLNPRWFVFENVEGLLTSGNGESVHMLVEKFIELGYSLRLEKVNFASYGVPQTRKRVLIIGNNLGLDFEFPEELFSFNSGKSKRITNKVFAPSVLEALDGLGAPSANKFDRVEYSKVNSVSYYDTLMRMDNKENSVTHHWCANKIHEVEIFSKLASGQSMKDLSPEFWPPSFSRRAFRRVKDGTPTEKRGGAPSGIKRLNGNLNSLTITGSADKEFIHPNENRTLSIRECARLQSFPDCFDFIGTSKDIIQQIGNAVPPIASQHIANHLLNLDSKFGSDIGSNSKIRSPSLIGFKLTDSLGMSGALKETENRLNSLYKPSLFK